jgi:hypothetical protein
MAGNRFQVTGVPRRKHVRHRESCMKLISREAGASGRKHLMLKEILTSICSRVARMHRKKLILHSESCL